MTVPTWKQGDTPSPAMVTARGAPGITSSCVSRATRGHASIRRRDGLPSNVPLHCGRVEASKYGKSSAVDGRTSALRTVCIK